MLWPNKYTLRLFQRNEAARKALFTSRGTATSIERSKVRISNSDGKNKYREYLIISRPIISDYDYDYPRQMPALCAYSNTHISDYRHVQLSADILRPPYPNNRTLSVLGSGVPHPQRVAPQTPTLKQCVKQIKVYHNDQSTERQMLPSLSISNMYTYILYCVHVVIFL